MNLRSSVVAVRVNAAGLPCDDPGARGSTSGRSQTTTSRVERADSSGSPARIALDLTQVAGGRNKLTHPLRCFLAVDGDWMAHLCRRLAGGFSRLIFKICGGSEVKGHGRVLSVASIGMMINVRIIHFLPTVCKTAITTPSAIACDELAPALVMSVYWS
jgi:hypothetical protein